MLCDADYGRAVLFQDIRDVEDLGGLTGIGKEQRRILRSADGGGGEGDMIIGVVADTVAEAQQLLVEVTGDQAGCADTEQTDGARLDDAPGDAFHDLFVKQMVGHVDGRDAVVMYGVSDGGNRGEILHVREEDFCLGSGGDGFVRLVEKSLFQTFESVVPHGFAEAHPRALAGSRTFREGSEGIFEDVLFAFHKINII